MSFGTRDLAERLDDNLSILFIADCGNCLLSQIVGRSIGFGISRRQRRPCEDCMHECNLPIGSLPGEEPGLHRRGMAQGDHSISELGMDFGQEHLCAHVIELIARESPMPGGRVGRIEKFFSEITIVVRQVEEAA